MQIEASGKIMQKGTIPLDTIHLRVRHERFLLGRFRTYLPKNVNSFQLAVAKIDNGNNIHHTKIKYKFRKKLFLMEQQRKGVRPTRTKILRFF